MVSLGGIARKLFGSSNDRRVKSFQPNVVDINALEPEMRALSDEALAAKTVEFRQQLADGKTLDDLLVPAFAVAREASRRALSQSLPKTVPARMRTTPSNTGKDCTSRHRATAGRRS